MEENVDTTPEVVEEETVKEPVKKTYTEEDIQNSFNAGVKKANSEWQKDEKYKEFLSWKKNSQQEGEKINELTIANTNLTKELEGLKAQVKVNESGVKKEFSKFVASEVMQLVNENTDFDEVLKQYKIDNPQYFGEVVVKKVQTSPSLSGTASKPQTTNNIMNSILRNGK